MKHFDFEDNCVAGWLVALGSQNSPFCSTVTCYMYFTKQIVQYRPHIAQFKGFTEKIKVIVDFKNQQSSLQLHATKAAQATKAHSQGK